MCRIAVSETYAMRLSGLEITFNLFFPLCSCLCSCKWSLGTWSNQVHPPRVCFKMPCQHVWWVWSILICSMCVCPFTLCYLCGQNKLNVWTQKMRVEPKAIFRNPSLISIYWVFVHAHKHTLSPHFRFNGYWTCVPVSVSFLKWAISVSSP